MLPSVVDGLKYTSSIRETGKSTLVGSDFADFIESVILMRCQMLHPRIHCYGDCLLFYSFIVLGSDSTLVLLYFLGINLSEDAYRVH